MGPRHAGHSEPSPHVTRSLTPFLPSFLTFGILHLYACWKKTDIPKEDDFERRLWLWIT
jgi:hypothetical protein